MYSLRKGIGTQSRRWKSILGGFFVASRTVRSEGVPVEMNGSAEILTRR